jgi:hypothetical protein
LYGNKAGEPVGEERMRELIEAADSEKLRKAAERVHAVVTARAGVLSDDEPRESVRKPPEDRAASGGGGPSDKPVWSLTVFVLAALVVSGRIILEYAQQWSDLGNHYLPQ